MNNPNLLVIAWQKDIPATEALSFTSARQVADQYGFSSSEARTARRFFSNNPGDTLYFIRYGMGQRPHIIGGNISTLTLKELQAISGSLDIQLSILNGPTWDYTGTVDMSTAKSFADAAQLIVAALDSSLPIAAKTTGDTLTAESLSFQGYVTPGQTSHLFVTKLDANHDPIVPGGIVSGLNIAPGSQIISQLNSTEPGGALGGTGEYDLFGFKGGTTAPAFQNTNPLTNTGAISMVASTTIHETYGLLSVGSVTAGQLTLGERIQPTPTNGIPALTAIAAQGPNGEWIVNNAVNASGDLTMTAPGLTVQQHAIVGRRTGAITNEFFDIQPDGHYGFNFNPSSMSAVTGTAADILGLSTASGAIVSSPGGQHFSIAGYMHRIITQYTDQYNLSILFGSFEGQEPRLDPFFTAWTQTPAGHSYTYLPGMPV